MVARRANGGLDMELRGGGGAGRGVIVGIACADDDKKSDAERIRGTWKVVSAKETAGFKDNIDVAEYKDSVWTFVERDLRPSEPACLNWCVAGANQRLPRTNPLRPRRKAEV